MKRYRRKNPGKLDFSRHSDVYSLRLPAPLKKKNGTRVRITPAVEFARMYIRTTYISQQEGPCDKEGNSEPRRSVIRIGG